MNKDKELGMYDRFVAAVAILAAIVGLFKGGLWGLVTGFFFPIILLQVGKALFCWVINPDYFNKN
ncbi:MULTISPECIES: hypothetical protein [unclassified Vibrio]|uniref:hypothetical protein n=1 Tax=unclassified Vibrio TaxID=2614977 RepID=UPI0035507465